MASHEQICANHNACACGSQMRIFLNHLPMRSRHLQQTESLHNVHYVKKTKTNLTHSKKVTQSDISMAARKKNSRRRQNTNKRNPSRTFAQTSSSTAKKQRGGSQTIPSRRPCTCKLRHQQTLDHDLIVPKKEASAHECAHGGPAVS